MSCVVCCVVVIVADADVVVIVVADTVIVIGVVQKKKTRKIGDHYKVVAPKTRKAKVDTTSWLDCQREAKFS